MRARVAVFLLALAAIAVGSILIPVAYGQTTATLGAHAAPGVAKAASRSASAAAGKAAPPPPRPASPPSTPPAPVPTLRAAPVSVAVNGYLSWALLDRKTGKIATAPNGSSTNTTESMIKIWIVSDHLRRLVETGKPQPSQANLATWSTAITDSNDNVAQDLFEANGQDGSTNRLIKMCGLTGTTIFPGWWSRTAMTGSDAVRMGQCVADGRAAGPKWTAWVLDQMRKVRGGVKDQPPGFTPSGGGRWGIIDGLPPELAKTVAIKNGWTPIQADGLWHINCLAVHDAWVLVVQMRYPMPLGLQYGANVCSSVTKQLVYQPKAG